MASSRLLILFFGFVLHKKQLLFNTKVIYERYIVWVGIRLERVITTLFFAQTNRGLPLI